MDGGWDTMVARQSTGRIRFGETGICLLEPPYRTKCKINHTINISVIAD